MVNAGRILIIAKGEWSNLVNYEQLDLVSYNQVAYLARQASVGVNPSTDSSMTYWQPFGSVSDIATTTTPGLVMPDGTTITIDNTGLIQAYVKISDIKDVVITSLATGDVLRYNATSQKWENVSISSIQTTVEQIIAPVEDATTTSRSYAVGESFIKNNVLYRAILPIAQGTSWSSLVLNTDYETAPSVSAQSQALMNDLGDITQLDTTDKSSAVNAINEIDGNVDTLSTAVDNKHKITTKTVSTSGWTNDTTSQSGVTLKKKSISLSHVYVESPSVDIGTSTGTGLPTSAQQEAYDLLQYVTVDGTTMYLYASDTPTTQFYIQIEGVD